MENQPKQVTGYFVNELLVKVPRADAASIFITLIETTTASE